MFIHTLTWDFRQKFSGIPNEVSGHAQNLLKPGPGLVFFAYYNALTRTFVLDCQGALPLDTSTQMYVSFKRHISEERQISTNAPYALWPKFIEATDHQ